MKLMMFICSIFIAIDGLFSRLKGNQQSSLVEVKIDKSKTLIESLRENGFDKIADRIIDKKTRHIVLDSNDNSDAQQLGASRIGGAPDLPNDIKWPKAEGKSLSFIAQINLHDITTVWVNSPLPKTGVLYFFYDAEQSVWGFDPKDKEKWAVIHTNETTEQLQEVVFPVDLPNEARFESKAVTPVIKDNYPDYEQLDIKSLGLSQNDDDVIFEIFNAYYEEGELEHKLLGYPRQIQGDMQLEVQLASHGLCCGDASGYNDPRAEKLKDGADQWQLLLQIDSDDDSKMMWGDSGMLYYWIKEQDLKEDKFENSWLILQCY